MTLDRKPEAPRYEVLHDDHIWDNTKGKYVAICEEDVIESVVEVLNKGRLELL